jgi:hypothetical protein
MADTGDRSSEQPEARRVGDDRVRESRRSLWRMFAAWRCTACGLTTSCAANAVVQRMTGR